MLPEDKHLAERVKGHLSGISLHKFTRAMISGLDANLKKPVKVFNIINTLNYPKFPELVFNTEKWKHTEDSDDIHIGYFNVFGIKYLTQERNLYRALNTWAKSLCGEKFILCVHHTYYPMMKAALKIKKKYRDKCVTCLVSGDIPGKYGLKSQYQNGIKETLIELMEKEILSMAKDFDSFILQTKYMAEGFGVSDKPYCVIECTYLPSEVEYDISKVNFNPENKKIVFYAGSLREEYDALHLINCFKYIKDNNFEFWLAGGGNAVEKIKSQANLDRRIKYLGFIPPKEVYERQQAATVLVSPRKSDHEFVKYSFPSKTMECLASGKPYVAHHLPCEPEEYSSYIQYPSDESDEALGRKLEEICNKSEDERYLIGEKSRKFILEQKNPKAMCARIVEFWERELTFPNDN